MSSIVINPFIFAGLAAPTTEDMDLTNLIAYWELEEASSTREDSHSTNDLADGNTVTSNTGVVATAASFARATAEYLSIADNAALSTGNIDFTLCAWVNLTTKPGDMDIISKYETATSNREYRLWYNNTSGRFTFSVVANGVGGGGNEAAAVADELGAPATATWYFIRAWHDATNNLVSIQVNGLIANETAYANGVFDGVSPFHIGSLGRAALGNHLDGLVDEAQFWKRLLTDDEHIQLYNDGSGLAYPLTGASLQLQPIYDGAWVWFGGPRATYYNGRTYVAWTDILGSNRVSAYDHANSRWDKSFVLNAYLLYDDHCAPTIFARPSDSKIMVFYAKSGDPNLRLRVSTNADDATAFGAEVNLDTAVGGSAYQYPSPVQLTGEANAPLYLFYMDIVSGSNRDLSYTKTDSSSSYATWSAQQRVFENGANRPYYHLAANGTGRIDFVVTDGHPNEVATNSIYHFYYDGGNWYASDGTLLSTGTASLPLVPAGVTQVYDGTTERAWNWDIAIDGSGNPVILFAKFVSTTDHRVMYARWNGSSWDVNEVTSTHRIYAAETYYSGGMCLDHDDVDVVYLSRQEAGIFEIQKWTTADSGATWAKDSDITTGSADDNYRPVVPRNSQSDLKVIWFYGPYASYTTYRTQLRTSPDTTR